MHFATLFLARYGCWHPAAPTDLPQMPNLQDWWPTKACPTDSTWGSMLIYLDHFFWKTKLKSKLFCIDAICQSVRSILNGLVEWGVVAEHQCHDVHLPVECWIVHRYLAIVLFTKYMANGIIEPSQSGEQNNSNLFLSPSMTMPSCSQSSTETSFHPHHQDLMECHQINCYYLCERHCVISTSANSSYLTALYSQQYDATLHLCNMELVDLTKSVLQLRQNTFLVYHPEKGLYNWNYLPEWKAQNHPRQRFFIPPNWIVQLRNHMLFSDTSVTLKTNQISYNWEWDNQLLGQYSFISKLKAVAHNKYVSLSLIDVIQMAETHQNSRYFGTLAIIGLAFTSIVIIILFFVIGLLLCPCPAVKVGCEIALALSLP